MPPRRNNPMFALPGRPPERLAIAGAPYRLVRVFKHDFFAATCLYESPAPGVDPPAVVVKFGRSQGFCGLSTRWLGELLRRREWQIYRSLSDVPGVPRCLGLVEPMGLAVEYIDAVPLDHLADVPPGLFDRLSELLGRIHARGVAYCDANKRSNILVGADASVWLIDYQIAFRRRPEWPGPLRRLVARAVAYMQGRDWYHLYKHKRRLAPGELTETESALSRRRGRLHQVHRALTTPWRRLRRAWLGGQHRRGRLVSPTASLEDHHQPEKATWRDRAADRQKGAAP